MSSQPLKETLTGSKSPPEKAVAAAGAVGDNKGKQESGKKKGFNTGVLCSVIADKLKEQGN